jgi:hypothetical protein
MRRRDLLTLIPAAAAAARADVPAHLWSGYDFGPGPKPAERLNQGPFDIDQDAGWMTIASTTPSDAPLRNPGLGLTGYAAEEQGPSRAVRAGREPLERHVEKLAALPFVDVFYIRCDWKHVQKRAGKLDLDPVWKLTLDAARASGRRVGFRVMLSNPDFPGDPIAIPPFLRDRIPLVSIGRGRASRREADAYEPRYDHPEFQKAFRELNELLAAEFDGNPLIEWVDLMQYGFWGEGHTSDQPNPFPDYATAERTMVGLTELQLEAWKRTPLAVNTQPDISGVGNRETLDMAVRAGCWLRSDSTIVEEPIQIEMLRNRPAWLAAVLEDGSDRNYDPAEIPRDAAGVPRLENAMLHVLDLGANYWSLWTETDNMARYDQAYPRGFRALRARMGYRVRPAWVWQRKRYGAYELIAGIANQGVAGVPGILRVALESPDGRFRTEGGLDAGHPHGGGVRQCAFLVPQEFAGQKLRLRASLEVRPGVRRPVRWAAEQPLDGDGALVVELLRGDAPEWRKGI